MPKPVRTRQVHLDFHTSEHIPGVGSRFDKAQWQAALKLGRVNLINIFAKCHHSWSYYPTKVGMVHPTLSFDLLGAQLEACHEIGVRAPFYFTMGWSATDAEMHPEWCCRTRDGAIIGDIATPKTAPDAPRPGFTWRQMCPSGEYHELIRAQTDELCRGYDLDGMWYDIYQAPHRCYCDNCRRGMADEGFDSDNEDDVLRFRALTFRRHMADLCELIRSHHPEAVTYFNGITTLDRPENVRFGLFDFNTQNDLEDLPTTWGGYDKFPLRARYFENVGKPYVAMSGKFHTSWGEFGGFKHPDAIRFEAASMVAYGAACNFGDQLHPLGEMDLDTYRSIGAGFEYVEQIEEYGVGAPCAANLGLWFSNTGADDEGAACMLLETQRDFRVVDPAEDFSNYDAIIVPGGPCLTDADAAKLTEYAASGGGLALLGEAPLDAGRSAFLLDVGARYVGPGEYDVDYTVVGDALSDDLVRSPFLNYEPALRVEPTDAQVLAAIREPYFSRTMSRYCSHQNTPYRPEDAAHPGALRKGNVIYLPHRLGRIYHAHGARLHRDLFSNALSLVHTKPIVAAELPSAGRVTVLRQPEHSRYVVHLLYATPLQRGRCLVIEDLVPLHNVPVQLRVPEQVGRCFLVPGGNEVEFSREGDAVTVVVPELLCHRAVVFEY